MVSMCHIQPLKMLNKIIQHKLQFDVLVYEDYTREKKSLKVNWYVIRLEWSRNLNRMFKISDLPSRVDRGV